MATISASSSACLLVKSKNRLVRVPPEDRCWFWTITTELIFCNEKIKRASNARFAKRLAIPLPDKFGS